MPFSNRLAVIGLFWVIGAISASAGDADTVQLRSELTQIRSSYQHWGLNRETRQYKSVKVDFMPSVPAAIPWDALGPGHLTRERFLRSGERFRSDCFEPAIEKRIYAFDGVHGRIRDRNHVHNGPLKDLRSAFERNFAPAIPHLVLSHYYYTPSLVWLFGTNEVGPLQADPGMLGEFTVEQIEYRQQPSWKINWRTVLDYEGGSIAHCEVVLAKHRHLLPIEQTFRTVIGPGTVEVKRIETEAFQHDPNQDLWFPQTVVASRTIGSGLRVSKIEFELTEQFNDSAIYSDVKPLAPEHLSPPPAIVPAFQPHALLARAPGPISLRQALAEKSRLGMGMVGVTLSLLGCLICYVGLRVTRIGRMIRGFFSDHRLLLGVTGVVLTAGVGYLGRIPPGWVTYGLAMMVAGVFGFLWIAFSMLLTGDKTLSIKTTLCIAACTALVFGGYNTGIKRMKLRQRMIHEVRDLGGEVVMGNWRLDEDGLFLPTQMRQLLGEAWTGRANRATIEQAAFTADNLSRWCVDEVQWLGIGSELGKPFEINAQAFKEFKYTDAMWTLHVDGGRIGRDCFRQLARFGELVDLHFDCVYQPVDPEIRLLQDVEHLWLTHAVVNKELYETLSRMQRLEVVTLVSPRFGHCDAVDTNLQIRRVEVQFATLNPSDLKTLGIVPAELRVIDSRFNLGSASEFQMPITRGFSVQTSDIDDSVLAKLVGSPNLAWIGLAGTDVTAAGVEAFSQLRPQISITLE
ncbi:hypothetical protein NHH03_24200 [Stieleria sp. TO1_6]|uniref:hypothetical protein n=1 Tax=Stieleria tagensis TaxID=2956795 RepID=UPI00209B7D05|nr:hypothetical protein [Stieleria tagensis]MCO8124862.1 hypothetical protein [Stieleria tagensis]